ncbi:MAG: amino acid permease [Thermoanaerobaculia bacterium]
MSSKKAESDRSGSSGSGEGAAAPQGELVRGLGVWDGILLTVGGVIGSGIFLVSSDIARVLPHGGMLLLVWLAGGLLALAGALTFAELGAMFPRAGGVYHYIKEAYGPLPGFLYGWACFLVIMSGGVAAIAVGFGEYLGSFMPFSSTSNILASHQFGSWTWTLSGVQVTAVAAILILTVINHFGLRQGAGIQNLMSVLKIGAIIAVGVLGFWVPAKAHLGITAPLPTSGLLAAFGVAMIAALWTYDGWYGLTFAAGEMKNPGRTLPLGLIGGTAILTALYLLVNFVYLRGIPVERMGSETRIGEAAANALFGPAAGQWLAAIVVVSTFGCLAATILYSSRIYQPMAADGLFFPSLAKIDPVTHVPARSLWAQSIWSILLTISGSYNQLYTYAVIVSLLFHGLAGAGVITLRRRRPDAERPYRVWGYPWVPFAFLAAMTILLVNTVFERPVESLLGLGLVALGLPAYAWLRRGSRGVARS